MEVISLKIYHKPFGWIDRTRTYDNQFDLSKKTSKSWIEENDAYLNNFNDIRLMVEKYVNHSKNDAYLSFVLQMCYNH